MITSSESAEKVHAMINKAIDDHKITQDEREQIMMLADEDGIIDRQEQALLSQLQDMIQNGTVKMVRE